MGDLNWHELGLPDSAQHHADLCVGAAGEGSPSEHLGLPALRPVRWLLSRPSVLPRPRSVLGAGLRKGERTRCNPSGPVGKTRYENPQ